MERVRCPSCKEPFPGSSPLCLQCGNHTGTGRRIPAADMPDGVTEVVKAILLAGVMCIFAGVIYWGAFSARNQSAGTDDSGASASTPSEQGDPVENWGGDIDRIETNYTPR